MKNIKFINIIMALALVCFGLTACSSDNDDNGGEAEEAPVAEAPWQNWQSRISVSTCQVRSLPLSILA